MVHHNSMLYLEENWENYKLMSDWERELTLNMFNSNRNHIKSVGVASDFMEALKKFKIHPKKLILFWKMNIFFDFERMIFWETRIMFKKSSFFLREKSLHFRHLNIFSRYKRNISWMLLFIHLLPVQCTCSIIFFKHWNVWMDVYINFEGPKNSKPEITWVLTWLDGILIDFEHFARLFIHFELIFYTLNIKSNFLRF